MLALIMQTTENIRFNGKLARNGLFILDIVSLWIRSYYMVEPFPCYLGKLVFCMSYKKYIFLKKKNKGQKNMSYVSVSVSARYLF